MTFDRVIAGGLAALPTGPVAADIGIAGESIAAIGAPGSLDGKERTEAAGLCVLPGAVDVHVHFREPGFETKEDFRHGSAAAVCGGVTTVCDMPNTMPAVTTAARLADKAQRIAPASWVDFGLWAGGVRTEEFAAMAAAGAVGLKVYMNRPRSKDDPYAAELSMPDDAAFVAALRAAAALDWPVAIHLASPAIDEARADELQAAGVFDPCAVCHSYRTPESTEAIQKAIRFQEVTGARVHMAHISLNALDALAPLRRAKQAGRAVTAEVVPPALSIEELAHVGVYGIPFSHREDELAVYWEALADGLIDAVATDHAPHARADKEAGRDNAWLAPPGYPGVETSYAIVLDAHLRGLLTLERVARIMAENPARIVGLPAKGRIAPGCDADLALFDPESDWTIDQAALHSKAGWSPYHGRRLRGRIKATMLRGRFVARDGALAAPAPAGRPVRPAGAERR